MDYGLHFSPEGIDQVVPINTELTSHTSLVPLFFLNENAIIEIVHIRITTETGLPNIKLRG